MGVAIPLGYSKYDVLIGANMAVISSEGVILANTTLFINLVKMLAAKGILSDDEWTQIVQGAVTELSRHDQGEDAIQAIKEITKVEITRVP